MQRAQWATPAGRPNAADRPSACCRLARRRRQSIRLWRRRQPETTVRERSLAPADLRSTFNLPARRRSQAASQRQSGVQSDPNPIPRFAAAPARPPVEQSTSPSPCPFQRTPTRSFRAAAQWPLLCASSTAAAAQTRTRSRRTGLLRLQTAAAPIAVSRFLCGLVARVLSAGSATNVAANCRRCEPPDSTRSPAPLI